MNRIQTFAFDQQRMFATAKVYRIGAGFTADIWWTVLEETQPRVVLHMTLPVLGVIEGEAARSAGHVVRSMGDIVPTLWSGEGVASEEAPSSHHVEAHLKYHGDHLAELGLSELEETAAMYRLLSDFRVKNPARRIATYLGEESVRSVHERVADARREGLIPKYGKGKSYE